MNNLQENLNKLKQLIKDIDNNDENDKNYYVAILKEIKNNLENECDDILISKNELEEYNLIEDAAWMGRFVLASKIESIIPFPSSYIKNDESISNKEFYNSLYEIIESRKDFLDYLNKCSDDEILKLCFDEKYKLGGFWRKKKYWIPF